ncbi:MAG TPA: GNAT family N-acetyltransferase [Nevskiaceae bacterium]|nr:GNAT family N-acetyltransferase [Nevskiaceae bacterium]
MPDLALDGGDVVTTYLEMHAPDALRRSPVPDPAPLFLRATEPLPELNRFLYTAVGGQWYWRDRLKWPYEKWVKWLDRPELETWLLYAGGTPAGYVELEKQEGDDVEIAYFGLIPRFIGRGLGGHLLTLGIERAWAMGAKRVWVHTCTLDGPAALANYQARGMTIYDAETHQVPPLGPPDGPWPGARPAPAGAG